MYPLCYLSYLISTLALDHGNRKTSTTSAVTNPTQPKVETRPSAPTPLAPSSEKLQKYVDGTIHAPSPQAPTPTSVADGAHQPASEKENASSFRQPSVSSKTEPFDPSTMLASMAYETQSWPAIRHLFPRLVVPVLTFGGAAVASTPAFANFPAVSYGPLWYVDTVFVVPVFAAGEGVAPGALDPKTPAMVPISNLGQRVDANVNRTPTRSTLFGPHMAGLQIRTIKQV